MTEYQFPSDPAAYCVEITRAGSGPVEHIAVRVTADGALLDEWSEAFDRLDTLLAKALERGRYEPGAMPTDEHIIEAALEEHGLLRDDMTDPAGLGLLGEDGEPEPDCSGIEGSVPEGADGWRDAVLLVEAFDRDGGSPYSGLERAGSFHDANRDCSTSASAIRLVARGLVDSATIGGGSAPAWRVTFHHDQEATIEAEDTAAETSADPMLDAAPAMLAALKAIVSGLTQAVQTCDLSGADLHRLEGAVGILRCDARFAVDRARQAIAKAEGRA